MRAMIPIFALLGMVCSPGTSQTLAVDPFIGSIEVMKHSVATVACMVVNDVESKILTRRGSAFFISVSGDFVTAGHVIKDMSKRDPPCPVSAIVLPVAQWQPDALNEPLVWFLFKPANCAIDTNSDIALCPLGDGPLSTGGPMIVPVTFHWSVPPDGTQVAFTGFPWGVRDPMTVRAAVVAHRPVWRNERPVDELLLDRAAWPGFSGSPVYLSDGQVIGVVVASQTDEGIAMTALRPVVSVKELLIRRKKN